jgi:hypothetical protein
MESDNQDLDTQKIAEIIGSVYEPFDGPPGAGNLLTSLQIKQAIREFAGLEIHQSLIIEAMKILGIRIVQVKGSFYWKLHEK